MIFTLHKEVPLSQIHATAIIDSAAEIDPTAEIGPFVVIEGPVRIGARTKLFPHAFVTGNVVIGEDNLVGVNVSIGLPPQHTGWKDTDWGVRIGDRNNFREHVTIHRGYVENNPTVVGDDNLLMVGTHVPHDAIIHNNVILVNCAQLGGHSEVFDRAVLSAFVGIHQFCRVGRLCMLGASAVATKDVPPFMTMGHDKSVHGMNIIGMRRAGIGADTRKQIKAAYKILYRSGLNVKNAVSRMESELGTVPEVREMIDFIQSAKRGIVPHTRRATADDDE